MSTRRPCGKKMCTNVKRCFLAAAVGALLLFAGCSSKQSIYLKNNGSGTAEISIQLHPVLIQYVEDIAGGLTGSRKAEEIRLFDKARIAKQINALPHAAVQSIETPSSGAVTFHISFDQISSLLQVPGRNGTPALFQFDSKGAVKTLVFTLSAENFAALAELSGLSGNELFSTFGPQENHPVTADEYRGMVEYLFDEYASKEAIDRILKRSCIQTDIRVQGTLKSVESSPSVVVSYAHSHAAIKIPLMDVLTLQQPLVIKIAWE